MFFGCSGKEEVKPSEDSILTTKTLSNITLIKTSYEQRDRNSLNSLLDKTLAEGILQELDFEKADLNLNPKIVKIKALTVDVNINWNGTWIVNSKTIKNRGIGVLILQKATLKLIRIDGDNPFLIPYKRD